MYKIYWCWFLQWIFPSGNFARLSPFWVGFPCVISLLELWCHKTILELSLGECDCTLVLIFMTLIELGLGWVIMAGSPEWHLLGQARLGWVGLLPASAHCECSMSVCLSLSLPFSLCEYMSVCLSLSQLQLPVHVCMFVSLFLTHCSGEVQATLAHAPHRLRSLA